MPSVLLGIIMAIRYTHKEELWNSWSHAGGIIMGVLFGVVFVEATEAKIYSQSVLNAVNANTSSSTSFVLKNAPPPRRQRICPQAGTRS